MNIPNYKILKEIGAGGMGTVYLAEHTLIKRKVAIKSLKQDLIKNEQLRERFKKEATALAQLEHPNIVRLNEYIEQQDGIFLIMEFVDGLPLDEHINNVSGPINEEKLIPMFLQILDAFEYAHKNKIVHRDIKPSNIIITKDGKIKVLDFGIAKIMDETNSMTKTGTQMGSVLYMSPEQVKGEKINHLSDIYSLGVTLFQMSTGKAPYDPTSNEYQIFQKIDKEPLPKASTIYPGVSKKIEVIIEKATNKNSSNRFQSCSEFKKVLSQKKNLETTKVSVSETIINEPSPISKNKSKNKKPLLIIASAIIIIGCIIGFNFFESKTKISLDKTTFKVDNNDIVYLKSNMKPLNGYLTCEYGIMGLYKDGKKEGVHKNWYSNGSLMSEEEIINGANVKISKKWYTDGSLKYLIDRDLRTFKKWYNSGELYIKANYFKEKLNGQYISFFKNGNKKSSGLYLNGKKDGEWKEWYENKQMKAKIHFQKGLLFGESIYWFNNGKLKIKGNYINGDGSRLGASGISQNGREGNWNSYHKNGKLEWEQNFKSGYTDGKHKYFNEDGVIEAIETFDFKKSLSEGEDVLNGYAKYFYIVGDNTSETIEGKYVNGIREGKWTKYQGNWKWIITYKNGRELNEAEFYNYRTNGPAVWTRYR